MVKGPLHRVSAAWNTHFVTMRTPTVAAAVEEARIIKVTQPLPFHGAADTRPNLAAPYHQRKIPHTPARHRSIWGRARPDMGKAASKRSNQDHKSIQRCAAFQNLRISPGSTASPLSARFRTNGGLDRTKLSSFTIPDQLLFSHKHS